MDFAVSSGNKEKIKESETRNKYLDLAREHTDLQNMKVMMIMIIEAIPNGLVVDCMI